MRPPFSPFFAGDPLSSGGFSLLYSCSFPLLESTCKFHFSGVQTCPVNPYLEWFRVVGKVKGYGLEYGLVRYRILHYDVGSFFPCLAPTLSLPLSSGLS